MLSHQSMAVHSTSAELLGPLRKKKSFATHVQSDLSILETNRELLHAANNGSISLLMYLLIPLGCVLIVGLVFFTCQRFKRGGTFEPQDNREFIPPTQKIDQRSNTPVGKGAVASNANQCGSKKSVKAKKRKKSSKKKRKKDVATAAAPTPTKSKQPLPKVEGTSYPQPNVSTTTRSNNISHAPERQNSPASAESAFGFVNTTVATESSETFTRLLPPNQTDLQNNDSPMTPSSILSADSGNELNGSISGLDSLAVQHEKAVELRSDYDEIFLEDNINLNSPHFPMPIEQLKVFILDLYKEFDADADGHIDHFELKTFFRAVESRGRMSNDSPLTDQEISEVLDAFDDDRNGTIERSEFCTWILSGLSKSPEEREAFAKTKPLARKLNNFLDGVVGYAERFSESGSKQFLKLTFDCRNGGGSGGGSGGGGSGSNLSSDHSSSTDAGLFASSSSSSNNDTDSGAEESNRQKREKMLYKPTTLKGHKHWVETVTVSLAGDLIFSGGVDAKIRMWNTATGKCLKRLSSHKNVITSLVCPPSDNAFGYHLCSGSVDKSIRLWNVEQGKCVGKLKGHQHGVTSVCISPVNPNVICSGSTDATAAIWDARSNKRVRKFIGHKESVDACAISADGELLCSASEDGSLRVWELATGQCLNVLRDQKNAGWIYSCDFSLKNRDLLCVGTHTHAVELWNVSGNTGGTLLKTLKGHKDAVMSVKFANNGSTIISGSMDNDLRLWEVETGQNLARLQGHTNMVSSVVFMPNNQQVVSGSRDHTVKVWAPQ
jgi:WD40 repeat protein